MLWSSMPPKMIKSSSTWFASIAMEETLSQFSPNNPIRYSLSKKRPIFFPMSSRASFHYIMQAMFIETSKPKISSWKLKMANKSINWQTLALPKISKTSVLLHWELGHTCLLSFTTSNNTVLKSICGHLAFCFTSCSIWSFPSNLIVRQSRRRKVRNSWNLQLTLATKPLFRNQEKKL